MLCNDCVNYTQMSADRAGDLLSRHFGLMPISEISRDQMESIPGDPQGWLAHVESSIIERRLVIDHLALVKTDRGLEIRNGNHRAWVAHQNRIDFTAVIFEPACGHCTEALFEDTLNAATRNLGWMHHQQGF